MKARQPTIDFTADAVFDHTKTLALMVAALSTMLVERGLAVLAAEHLGESPVPISDLLEAQGFTIEQVNRLLPHAVVMVLELRGAGVLKIGRVS